MGVEDIWGRDNEGRGLIIVAKEVPNTEYTYDISQLAFGQMSERHVFSEYFVRLAFIFRGTRGEANLRLGTDKRETARLPVRLYCVPILLRCLMGQLHFIS
jgi:hypothetical protein